MLAVAVTGWRLRRVSHQSDAFGIMLALVLAVTLVIVPTFAPYNQVLLLPAVFLIAAGWRDVVEPGSAHPDGLRTRVPCRFLAVVDFVRIDAGVAAPALRRGSKSVDVASLYQPGYSACSAVLVDGLTRLID